MSMDLCNHVSVSNPVNSCFIDLWILGKLIFSQDHLTAMCQSDPRLPDLLSNVNFITSAELRGYFSVKFSYSLCQALGI